MSVSSSLRAVAAPQHFERIAKNLQMRRAKQDYSTCDIKIKLKGGGHDMVHHMVVTVYSTYLSQAFENYHSPFPPVDLRAFEPASVRRIFDWMYSGEITVPDGEIANDLAVASFLRVNLLQYQFEQSIRKLKGRPIEAINIASSCTTTKEDTNPHDDKIREENAFRPNLTLYNVRDDTMNQLVLDVVTALPTLKSEQVDELTNNSILACMSTVLPMNVKVPLINLAIQWILNKKASANAINAIVQSIVISDVTMDTLYSIRYNLKQYLSNPQLAGKAELSISPRGVIGLSIDPRKGIDKSLESQNTPLNQCNAWRSKSEIEDLNKIPDVFSKLSISSSSTSAAALPSPDPSSPCFRRETTDGFPKYFTRSEVENLRAMSDPFIAAKNEAPPPEPKIPHIGFNDVKCTRAYPDYSQAELDRKIAAAQAKAARNAGKWTGSEYEANRVLPDPFLPPAASRSRNSVHRQQPTQSYRNQTPQRQQSRQNQYQNQKLQNQGPVELKPVRTLKFGEPNPEGFLFGATQAEKDAVLGARSSKSNASFSERPYNRKGNGGYGSGYGGGAKASHNKSFSARSSTTSAGYRSADFVIFPTSPTRSSASTTSVRNPQMQGVKKTASEIAEINQLPAFHSRSNTSMQGNGSNLNASSSGTSSKQPKEAAQRSAYLYPK